MKTLFFLPAIFLISASLFALDSAKDKNARLKEMGAMVENDPKFPPVVSFTLKNGLKILLLEKHFVPTVSFTMMFRVGNVDNPSGKTGLAHLFEHMAFKGTKTINTSNYENEKIILNDIEKTAKELIAEESKTRPDGQKIKELTEKLSGLEKKADQYIVREEYWKIYSELGESGMNAMTSPDYTGYVVSLPSNRLHAWFIIEADRFRNPVMREFYRERNVVMEERRQNESDPNRVVWETLFSHAFDAHPYRNPTIGWMDDLRKLTRTDAEEFFSTFYSPCNATLAIVGDIDPEETIRLAKRYFEDIPQKKLPQTNYTIEPDQNSEKKITVFFKAKPALRMGFHNPGIKNEDMPGIIILSELFSSGKTGRFYKNLVDGKQIALYANSYHSTPGNRFPSLFVISAAPKAPHTLEELESAVIEEIEKVKKESPAAWEMEKIINNYEADLIKQLESNSGLGMSLAYGQQILEDWKYDWEILEQIKKLKPEDISKVCAKYLTRANRTLVFLKEE
ncbi:MAG: insulinase family protein [Elusimicrobia bacterium]|nr:insulinase family protein [Elusimicrobiota bacterium]